MRIIQIQNQNVSNEKTASTNITQQMHPLLMPSLVSNITKTILNESIY
jgi:hypothetical protein